MKHPSIQLFFRVILGIIITLKGLFFLTNPTKLDRLIRLSPTHSIAGLFWDHLIAISSLLCGILIITGLLTRLASALQIPIMAGMLIFTATQRACLSNQEDAAFSLLTLITLFYFLVKGPGEISMDNYLRNQL
ncbi:DoxX family protein [Flavihumibacter sp. CACIAM 22H1]|uniref:DoxX family protein n=1 Tax=Flavihumibacter sp. CACIAM 22H1 TaxID=1812911 RepID=UPI0007A7DDED|nr:DoxX family protein [Flavihumibacter sp. CACIAM 22H1]KYP15187.1 MAG: hypothetical protein A1D16_00515 [Flavihumibacter sp. CACIAM 22H1]